MTELKPGLMVRPNDTHPDKILASDCGVYHFAMVLSVKPFRLISETGDMMWFHQDIRNFDPVAPAGEKILDAVRHRAKIDPDNFRGIDLSFLEKGK